MIADEGRLVRDSFFARCYEVVRQIPYGKVATYGQVARLMGEPRKARYVGYALHANPEPILTPCHRVVFADGSVTDGFVFGGPDEQRRLLEEEGVGFTKSGRVDMRRFQWEA